MNSSPKFGPAANELVVAPGSTRLLRTRSKLRFLNAPALSALAAATILSFAGSVVAQVKAAPTPAMAASAARAASVAAKAASDKAKAALQLALANAKHPVAKPHPLLAAPFNPQVGPQLIAHADQMHAVVAAAKTPADVGPALAKIAQIWPQHQNLVQQMDTQLEQIAAHDLAGKKTPEMKNVEAAVGSALATRAQAMNAELLRLSKLPLSPKDMSALQNLQKALAG